MSSREQRIDLLADAILNVARDSQQSGDAELTAFLGCVGHKYQNELLLIGRATNGWEPNWLTSEVHDRRQAIRIANQAAHIGSDCPLAWVYERWGQGEKDEYRSSQSAFWRTARQVLTAVDPDSDLDEEWSSRLSWTNLYKISPDGGNPSNRLCHLQFGQCSKILKAEIREFAPKRILFSTGDGWAYDFLTQLGAKIKIVDGEHVGSRGAISLGRHVSEFVVADHPQGRREADWVNEVVNAFRT